MTYGNGKTTLVTYDDRARAVAVTAADVIDLAYGYDGADNVRSFDNTEVPNSQRTMTYDALDRLETATASSQWGVALYQYDALGNRTYRSVGGGATTFAYDAQNRLASASTNILPNGSMAFTWDDASRMVTSSDGATYRYDGHDRRIEKAEATQTMVYHHDPSGRVIAETLPDGTRLRDYFYLGNRLIAVDGCVGGAPPNCAAERQWYHTDTLGSVLARTDMGGAVWARLDYEPWGEEYSQTGVPGDRQYNGRVYDPGTGFHDYGARLYWPAIGRFVSADTVAGSPPDPASLNRYSYVHNNPYKYIDPTGHIIVVTGAKMEAALKELLTTKTGDILYVQLRDSKRTFRLREGDDTYSRSDNDDAARRGWRTGTGSGGETTMDFNKKYVFHDENDVEREAPFPEVLGHEMRHLADYDSGHLDINPVRGHPNQTCKERDAIETENEIRKEFHLPGQRTLDSETRVYDRAK